MQPVHDHDDRTAAGVVQPAVEGVVEPVVGRLPLGLRQRLLGLQRVVDDDDVRTPPGQHATNRGREPAALCGRLELGCGLPLRREPGGEELPVPAAGDNVPAVARQFVGEVLRVADTEELGARVVAEAPGRKADRAQMRLQVARRHVDDWAYPIVLIEIIFHPTRRKRLMPVSTAIRWNKKREERRAFS